MKLTAFLLVAALVPEPAQEPVPVEVEVPSCEAFQQLVDELLWATLPVTQAVEVASHTGLGFRTGFRSRQHPDLRDLVCPVQLAQAAR